MITLKPYEDELLYSYFARLFARSGLLTYRDIADYLYANIYHPPNIYFTNGLTASAYQKLETIKSYSEWIIENTMYPCFSKFLPEYRQKQVLMAFVEQNGQAINQMALPNMAQEHLHYCPQCVIEDREKYGETYWHRKWQLPHIEVCPIHTCYLCSTDISVAAKQSPQFYLAEAEILDLKVIPCEVDWKLELAQFMVDLFEEQSVIHIIPVVQKALIQNGYKNGVSNKLENLCNDIKNKSGMTISATTIGRVLQGKYYRWYEICNLLLFLEADLSVEDRDCIGVVSGSTKQSIYEEVSKKMNVDYAFVQDIGREIFRLYDQLKGNYHAGGVQKYNYSVLDKSLVDKVRNKCEEIYNLPRKVTKSLVARELELPQKQLDKMPICLEVISRYSESQEEYWVRLLLYTIDKLEQEGQDYCWKTIRDLTNIRKKNIIRTLPYMDEKLKQKMIDLLRIDLESI